MTQEEVVIRLSRSEYEVLLLALGFATGAAVRDHDTQLAHSFVRLANAVNKDQPGWVPYKMPEDAGTVKNERTAD